MTEIPVPPFGDKKDADRFHRLLLLYLRELKQPGDPVALHQFLLGQALHWHAPQSPGACEQCGPPYPCRTLLSVAALSRFPAPWSPVSLARAMLSAGLLERGDHADPCTQLRWGIQLRWGSWSDVVVTATRDQRTGSWLVRSQERGNQETTRLADDAACCDYLQDQARYSTFPYGWAVEPSWVPAVRPGVARARAWWSRHGQLPYLAGERPGGTP